MKFLGEAPTGQFVVHFPTFLDSQLLHGRRMVRMVYAGHNCFMGDEWGEWFMLVIVIAETLSWAHSLYHGRWNYFL